MRSNSSPRLYCNLRHQDPRRMNASVLIGVLFAALLAACIARADGPSSAAATHAATAPFKPLWNQAALTLDQQAYKTAAVIAPYHPDVFVGTRHFAIYGDTVEEIANQKFGTSSWSAKSPDAVKLRYMAWAGPSIYVSGYRQKDAGSDIEELSPLQLRRLDIHTHQWLKPRTLAAATQPAPHSATQPAPRQELDAAVAQLDDLAVLSAFTVPETFEEKVVNYRLSFRGQGDTPAWTLDLGANGSRPQPGVGLWAARMPDYASSGVRHLAWVGDDLLVCAGEKEDILLIDRAGKIKWRLPCIWEFERGFIGPSVWSHYISRFGSHADESAQEMMDQPPDPKATEDQLKYRQEIIKQFKDAREGFYKSFQCAIVGGPVCNGDPSPDVSGHIFVAVAKGPNAWNWGYLSDCIIYELDADSGHVLAMSQIPRMVRPAQFAVLDKGSLAWMCEKGGMLNLKPFAGPADWGPGGPDRLCDIHWYRQYDAPEPAHAWLSADPAADVTAFGSRYALRTLAGGYIADKAEKIYRFPIALIDLASGDQKTATLAVPFEGDVPEPKTNVGWSNGHIAAMGSYLLGVTQMRLHFSRLFITLGIEGSAAQVAFDVEGIEPQEAR